MDNQLVQRVLDLLSVSQRKPNTQHSRANVIEKAEKKGAREPSVSVYPLPPTLGRDKDVRSPAGLQGVVGFSAQLRAQPKKAPGVLVMDTSKRRPRPLLRFPSCPEPLPLTLLSL